MKTLFILQNQEGILQVSHQIKTLRKNPWFVFEGETAGKPAYRQGRLFLKICVFSFLRVANF